MNTDADPIHRILVVDDNPSIHDDFRKILGPRSAATKQLGAAATKLFGRPSRRTDALRFEIDCVSRGQEGLDKVRAAAREGRPYSMAYVDVRMPNGWDGIETICRIWQDRPNLLVVICTAFSDHSWDDIQERLGFSDRFLILKKPFDNLEVRQLTWALVERAQAERDATIRSKLYVCARSIWSRRFSTSNRIAPSCKRHVMLRCLPQKSYINFTASMN